MSQISLKADPGGIAVVALEPAEYVAPPTFSRPAGAYVTSVEIALDCVTVGATIYYTTDGSVPTEASTEYVAPFTLTP